jgi:hypothetical protein
MVPAKAELLQDVVCRQKPVITTPAGQSHKHDPASVLLFAIGDSFANPHSKAETLIMNGRIYHSIEAVGENSELRKS